MGESPGELGTGPGHTPISSSLDAQGSFGVWLEGEAHTEAAFCLSPREVCSLPWWPEPADSFLVADTAPLVVAQQFLPRRLWAASWFSVSFLALDG